LPAPLLDPISPWRSACARQASSMARAPFPVCQDWLNPFELTAGVVGCFW